MLKQVWALFGFFTGLCKRAMCFLSKKRHNSGDSALMPTSAGAPPQSSANDTVAWGSWGADEGFSVEVDPASRPDIPPAQQLVAAQQMEEEELEPDFFSGMTPQFTKAAKIRLKSRAPANQESMVSSRLSMATDIPPMQAELGTWEDEEGQGWEADDGDIAHEASMTLKQSKMEERRARQDERREKMAQQRQAKPNSSKLK